MDQFETCGWEKVNDQPIKVDFSLKDGLPSFWWNNTRHFMEDFIRCHNNPYFPGQWPDFVHAYEAESNNHPLFIEMVEGDCVNIWEEAA